MGNNWTTMIGNNFIYGIEQNSDYFSAKNYENYNNPLINGLNFRKGVRGGIFVKDVEIVVNGFSQLEGIGWQNIFSIS